MTILAAVSLTVRGRVAISRFGHDERGAMAFFLLTVFILMLMVGGIAVDVMRFESRRVAMQQTMDRAALAAANLNNSDMVTPTAIVNDYFDKADLGSGLEMVEFGTPVITATPVSDKAFRKVELKSSVRSHNFFMHLLNVDYLEGPTASTAEQGMSQVEIILVLDVSYSMTQSAGMSDDPATTPNEAGWSKIVALRSAAKNFVKTVKDQDTKNQVSIGIVPYNAQVKIPANLRDRFTVSNLAVTNGIATGVANGNCFEIPASSYTSTALSRTVAIPMAAVADLDTDSGNTSSYVAPTAPVDNSTRLNRICNTIAGNHVFLPTEIKSEIDTQIDALTAGGYTSIALGMRWGMALIDESASPIYTAIGSPTVAGRPSANNATTNRKIIVLMTDGEHYEAPHIKDAYKTGLSPIYRGADGKFAIQFTTGGLAFTGGARPTCAGTNTYFVPHLKPSTSTSCNSAAWKPSMTGTPWTGSGTVSQLDWSEVWSFMPVKYLARQIYGRSNVGGTSYSTVFDGIVQNPYLTVATLNDLLSKNCAAGRTAGIEVYGIALAAPANGQTVIKDCASLPKENYYFNATNGTAMDAAFSKIASNVSALRLTQ